jgi:hypothetical protein
VEPFGNERFAVDGAGWGRVREYGVGQICVLERVAHGREGGLGGVGSGTMVSAWEGLYRVILVFIGMHFSAILRHNI